jgi:apolipoprotein N-acyltransferase
MVGHRDTVDNHQTVGNHHTAISFLLAAVSGLAQVLLFPRFSLWFLAPLAVAPLLVAVARETGTRRRFLLGWLAGAIYWAGSCYWIYDVMHRYAYMAAPAAVAIFAGFFLVKGLHLGVFAMIAAPLLRRPWAIPAVAAAWVAVEGSHQYLAFTWLHLGNAGVSMAVLARLAPYTGVYGLSFAFAMMNVALALVALRRPRREMLWLAPLLLLYLLPALPAVKPGDHTARLVQPNVHPDDMQHWDRAVQREHLARMRQLSTETATALDATPPELLIWPEYPVPGYFFDDPGFRAYMEDLARQTNTHVILNAIAFRDGDRGRPLNSALVLSPQGELLSHYSKIFLVPFGEFVPWPFSLFINKITLEAGDFTPGDEVVVTQAGEHKIGTFICYESVFARGVRRFTAQGAELLVNLSNDSWYGSTSARHQHLLIARMRAAENARWLLRATNDGITSVIDPGGRVVASLPSFQQGVLSARFDYLSETTWFTRFGEWFWWLSLVVTAGLWFAGRKHLTVAPRSKETEPRV